jgi:hypothetical protein
VIDKKITRVKVQKNKSTEIFSVFRASCLIDDRYFEENEEKNTLISGGLSVAKNDLQKSHTLL